MVLFAGEAPAQEDWPVEKQDTPDFFEELEDRFSRLKESEQPEKSPEKSKDEPKDDDDLDDQADVQKLVKFAKGLKAKLAATQDEINQLRQRHELLASDSIVRRAGRELREAVSDLPGADAVFGKGSRKDTEDQREKFNDLLRLVDTAVNRIVKIAAAEGKKPKYDLDDIINKAAVKLGWKPKEKEEDKGEEPRYASRPREERSADERDTRDPREPGAKAMSAIAKFMSGRRQNGQFAGRR